PAHFSLPSSRLRFSISFRVPPPPAIVPLPINLADRAMRRALICVVANLLTATSMPAEPPSAKPPHWAFQPPQRPTLPKVSKSGWVRTPVDAFILARLEKEKIAPSPEADKATLLRRLCLDLLGLPPTPQMLDQFLRDTGSDAYERLVDSLLESPHYGE